MKTFLKTLLRMILGGMVALTVGIVATFIVMFTLNIIGVGFVNSGHPQGNLGAAILLIEMVMFTAVVGAVAGALRRSGIGALVGLALAGIIFVIEPGICAMVPLVAVPLVAWTVGGGAAGAIGRLVYPDRQQNQDAPVSKAIGKEDNAMQRPDPGSVGYAMTPLAPEGTVEIAGASYSAQSERGHIEVGRQVAVTGFTGMLLFVRESDPKAGPGTPTS